MRMLLLLLLLAACSPTSPASPAASPPALPGSVEARFELVLIGEPADLPTPEDLVRAAGADLRVDGPSGAVSGPTVSVKRVSDLQPPPADLVARQGQGLGEWEREVLTRPYAGLTMLFRAPSDQGARLVRLADELVLALAKERRVFVDDIEARVWFTKEEWKQVVGAGVQRHISFHAYQDGEFLRIVSLGMRKFGRPDLVLEGVPHAAAPVLGELLNLVAQEIVDHGLPASGVLQIPDGDLRLRLTEAQPEPGDADNPLVSFDVSEFAGATLQERLSTVATKWGGGPAPLTMVRSGDEELEGASAAARQRLLEDVKPRFLAGLPEGEVLLVKGPFGPPDETEWIWVTVRSWEGRKIRGLLVEDAWNDPKLKAGMEVLVPEGAVFDYLLRKRDGSTEGGTTDEILGRRRE